MNPRPIEQAQDPDLRHSMAALQRAALRAQELARQTGTCLVVERNGRVELIPPEHLPLAQPGTQPPAARP